MERTGQQARAMGAADLTVAGGPLGPLPGAARGEGAGAARPGTADGTGRPMDGKMDSKEKIRWLGQYQAALRRQALLGEELAALRAEAEHMTAALRGVPGGGAPDAGRMPRAVERIVEAQAALEEQIAACMQCRAAVASAVAMVGHPQQQEVLRRRYLLGQAYAQIADEMGLVERRVFQLHRQGVEALGFACAALAQRGDLA